MGEIENKHQSKGDGQNEVEGEKMKVRFKEREKGTRNKIEDRRQEQGYQGQELVGEHHDGEDMEEGEHHQDGEEESEKEDNTQGPEM